MHERTHFFSRCNSKTHTPKIVISNPLENYRRRILRWYFWLYHCFLMGKSFRNLGISLSDGVIHCLTTLTTTIIIVLDVCSHCCLILDNHKIPMIAEVFQATEQFNESITSTQTAYQSLPGLLLKSSVPDSPFRHKLHLLQILPVLPLNSSAPGSPAQNAYHYKVLQVLV